jgi:hypothetical protein
MVIMLSFLVFLAYPSTGDRLLPRLEIPRIRPEPEPEPAPRPFQAPDQPGYRPPPADGPAIRPDTSIPDHQGLSHDDFENLIDAVSAIIDGASDSEYTTTTMTVVDIQNIPARISTLRGTPGCLSTNAPLPFSCTYSAPTFTSFIPERTETSTVTEQLLRPKSRYSEASYLTITTTAVEINATRSIAVVVAYPTHNSTLALLPVSASMGSNLFSLRQFPFATLVWLAFGLVIFLC